MKIKCSKCEYKWEYTGKMTFYATCPNCKKSNKLKEVDKNAKPKSGDSK